MSWAMQLGSCLDTSLRASPALAPLCSSPLRGVPTLAEDQSPFPWVGSITSLPLQSSPITIWACVMQSEDWGRLGSSTAAVPASFQCLLPAAPLEGRTGSRGTAGWAQGWSPTCRAHLSHVNPQPLPRAVRIWSMEICAYKEILSYFYPFKYFI